MRLQVLSDIHTEFHKDQGKGFVVDYLKPDTVDILVIAGDLGTWRVVPDALGYLSEHYSKADIVYVPGNHEFYGTSSTDAAIDWIARACTHMPNVHFLVNAMKVIRGVPFVGSTLWFKPPPVWVLMRNLLADYSCIPAFASWVEGENKRSVDFLKWHVTEDSFVVSHHLPTYQSVTDQYKTSTLTPFYVHNLEKLIIKRKPKLWVHGHAHTTLNYMLGRTNVVCNALGYVGRDVNPEFIPNMYLDI